MQEQSMSISGWMKSSHYGLSIASRPARTAARYFRPLVGALVGGLLVSDLVHVSLLAKAVPWPLVGLTAVSVLAYLGYLVFRAHLAVAHERSYYAPRIQWLLAQASIAGTGLLMLAYAWYGYPNLLWPLFVPPIMIISEHCGTNALLAGVVEVLAILVSAAWLGNRPTAQAFLWSAAFLEGMAKIVGIGLVVFLLHYTMRNLDARDKRIGDLRDLFVHISKHLSAQRDPKAIRQEILHLFVQIAKAESGAVWVPGRQPGILTMETRSGPCGTDCPDVLTQDIADPAQERLPSQVMRAGHVLCIVCSGNVPKDLESVTVRGHPICSETVVEIGVPLQVFQLHRPQSVAVATLDFQRSIGKDELDRLYRTVEELAGLLSPVLYYVSLMEEHLALRDLGRAVSRGPEQMPIMDALLDVITTTLGFDFATVSLVNETRQVIQTVRGRNVDPEWIRRAGHSLDSNDIQADVVRMGKTEILRGWDDRFDREIWEKFGHEGMVRVFMPMTVLDRHTGQATHIGVVEAGYRDAAQAEVLPEQVSLLEPFVDQASLAVYQAQLYEEARRHANALEHLHEVGQAIQRATWSVPRLMQEIGNHALDVAEADIVLLYGYDEESHRIELLHTAGEIRGPNPSSARLDQGSILDSIIASRQPFYTEDAQHCSELVGYGSPDDEGNQHHTFARRLGVQAFAGIPLLSGKRLVGIMCVNYRQAHRFADAGKRIIELFAQMAAEALESARLKDMDKERALQMQRNRLARELHDALVQDLYGASLKLGTWLQEPGLHPDHATTLSEILKLAEGARQQIGYLVDELRAPLLSRQDFRQTIRETIERIERFHNVPITYDDSRVANVHVASMANTALAHIAKEGITNSVRHSRAGLISIHCDWHEPDKSVCLQVKDDGIGFDPDHCQRGGNGLQTMREFANEAGGRLRIVSHKGQGTEITAYIPADAP